MSFTGPTNFTNKNTNYYDVPFTCTPPSFYPLEDRLAIVIENNAITAIECRPSVVAPSWHHLYVFPSAGNAPTLTVAKDDIGADADLVITLREDSNCLEGEDPYGPIKSPTVNTTDATNGTLTGVSTITKEKKATDDGYEERNGNVQKMFHRPSDICYTG